MADSDGGLAKKANWKRRPHAEFQVRHEFNAKVSGDPCSRIQCSDGVIDAESE